MVEMVDETRRGKKTFQDTISVAAVIIRRLNRIDKLTSSAVDILN
jgi:hypothetical protein